EVAASADFVAERWNVGDGGRARVHGGRTGILDRRRCANRQAALEISDRRQNQRRSGDVHFSGKAVRGSGFGGLHHGVRAAGLRLRDHEPWIDEVSYLHRRHRKPEFAAPTIAFAPVSLGLAVAAGISPGSSKNWAWRWRASATSMRPITKPG